MRLCEICRCSLHPHNDCGKFCSSCVKIHEKNRIEALIYAKESVEAMRAHIKDYEAKKKCEHTSAQVVVMFDAVHGQGEPNPVGELVCDKCREVLPGWRVSVWKGEENIF